MFDVQLEEYVIKIFLQNVQLAYEFNKNKHIRLCLDRFAKIKISEQTAKIISLTSEITELQLAIRGAKKYSLASKSTELDNLEQLKQRQQILLQGNNIRPVSAIAWLGNAKQLSKKYFQELKSRLNQLISENAMEKQIELICIQLILLNDFISLQKLCEQYYAQIKDLFTEKNTFLLLGCEYSSTDIIDLIVQNGADVNSVTSFTSPLLIAAQRQKLDLFNYLLQQPNLDLKKQSVKGPFLQWLVDRVKTELALVYSVGYSYKCTNEKLEKYRQMVVNLIKHNADVKNINFAERSAAPNSETILHWAIKNVQPLEFIQYLFDNTIIDAWQINARDPNGRTALHLAVIYDRPEVVQYLINLPEIDINIVDNDKCSAIACCFINKGLLENAEEMASLLAPRANNLDVLKKDDAYGNKFISLIEWSIEADLIDIFNCCVTLHPKLLFRKGFFFTYPEYLHLAAKHGSVKVAQALLSHGYPCNQPDNENKNTPLHHAAQNGQNEIVKLLLQCDEIKVNQVNKYGDTPLHLAAQYRHVLVAIYLLNASGLNIDIKNDRKRTALDEALTVRSKEIAAQILAFKEWGTADLLKRAQQALHENFECQLITILMLMQDLNEEIFYNYILTKLSTPKYLKEHGETLIAALDKLVIKNIECLIYFSLFFEKGEYGSQNFAKAKEYCNKALAILNTRVDILSSTEQRQKAWLTKRLAICTFKTDLYNLKNIIEGIPKDLQIQWDLFSNEPMKAVINLLKNIKFNRHLASDIYDNMWSGSGSSIVNSILEYLEHNNHLAINHLQSYLEEKLEAIKGRAPYTNYTGSRLISALTLAITKIKLSQLADQEDSNEEVEQLKPDFKLVIY